VPLEHIFDDLVDLFIEIEYDKGASQCSHWFELLARWEALIGSLTTTHLEPILLYYELVNLGMILRRF
jgi:hypothetical protein